MSNCVYVQFQKVENFNIEGESLSSYWQVNVWDDHNQQTFSYEDLAGIIEDWKKEDVLRRLKDFDVFNDFEDTLERKKGFYYPSASLLGTWVDIDMEDFYKEN